MSRQVKLKLTREFSQPWDRIAYTWEEADCILMNLNPHDADPTRVETVRQKLQEMKKLIKECLKELPS